MAARASWKSTAEIYDIIARGWARCGVSMVNVTALRSFLRGRPHRRGKVDARGRKRSFSRRNVLFMNAAMGQVHQSHMG